MTSPLFHQQQSFLSTTDSQTLTTHMKPFTPWGWGLSKCLLSSHAITCPFDPIHFKPFLLDSYRNIIITSLLTSTFTTTVKQAWVKITCAKPYIITDQCFLFFIASTLQWVICSQNFAFLSQQDNGQSDFKSGQSAVLQNVTEAQHVVRGIS